MADAAGATRAVGASLGAAALCSLVTRTPDRFERLVFFLPAALDGPSPPGAAARFAALRDGDVTAEVPAPLRETKTFQVYARQRAEQLARHPLAPALVDLLDDVPVPDPTALAAVHVPALVIGCTGDPMHPAPVAQRLAAALGNATLDVYDRPAVLWTARRDLRERISGFLNDRRG